MFFFCSFQNDARTFLAFSRASRQTLFVFLPSEPRFVIFLGWKARPRRTEHAARCDTFILNPGSQASSSPAAGRRQLFQAALNLRHSQFPTARGSTHLVLWRRSRISQVPRDKRQKLLAPKSFPSVRLPAAEFGPSCIVSGASSDLRIITLGQYSDTVYSSRQD